MFRQRIASPREGRLTNAAIDTSRDKRVDSIIIPIMNYFQTAYVSDAKTA